MRKKGLIAKKGIIIVLSNHSFHRNIELFSIISCKVIALNLLCLKERQLGRGMAKWEAILKRSHVLIYKTDTKMNLSYIFLLRFGLANAINDYYGLKFVLCM